MKPTDEDDDIPDDTQDELVAQIVPLRRRDDDTEHREQDEPQASVDGTDDWSVFDPPEDLQLAERPRRDQPREPDSNHDLPGADLERPWTSMPRLRSRLVAFAGVALTLLAIATLAVLTLKDHSGASTRELATPTPPATITSASRPLAARQRGSAAPPHRRRATRPNHHKPTKRKSSPHAFPHIALASTGEEVSTGRGSVEPSPAPARSEPSPTGTSPTRNAASEFGIER